ncbi:MAG: TerB family tellurite resistance protein [Ruminococcus sp.]|nr:TerB family tellurite resistance protein [Ruminococcus sp.]
MKMIPIKNAVAIFYYMMSVDGTKTETELQKVDEIGVQIDVENYIDYRDEMMERCEKQKESVIDEEDFYDVISEGVDKELYADISEDEMVIASRLLIWNLLVVAYSDDEYHREERRLIKHIVRVSGMPTSVFLEMEQLIRALNEVENERKWLETSERPYREIAPIIAELDKRIAFIAESAKNLIADETMAPFIEASDIMPDVSDREEEAVALVSEKIEETSEPAAADDSQAVAPAKEGDGETFDDVKTAVSEFATGIGKSIGGFFGGFGKKE